MANEPEVVNEVVVSPELKELLEIVHYSSEEGLDSDEGWDSEEASSDPDDEELPMNEAPRVNPSPFR